MSAVKIVKFLGEAPKISGENLPDTAAQFAYNTKLYSGDLIPFSQSSLEKALARTGTINTIYPLTDTSNIQGKGITANLWLSWNTDVDVAKAAMASNSTQRIYYTGDTTGNGEPKVTNYLMATSNGTTADLAPTSYYTLGFPIPPTAPTVAATSFTTLTISTRARDSGNTATIVTSAPHGLNSGASVTTTTFADTTFNLTNAQITVVNSTTFTYYCPGAAVVAGADAAARVDLSGATYLRTYVYTWLTAWGEESAPSPTSSQLYIKEGQTVTISGLPSAFPTTGSYAGGVYQTAGMVLRLYRSVTSASGSSYFKVADISLGTTSYVDTLASNTLTTALPSLYYDMPPSNLQGIKAIHNNMMVGFYGNTVCFCEPNQPHAWPVKYQQSLDADIVAIDNVGQTIVVLTKKNPWVMQGAVPSVMSKTRMDYTLTCTSKRGVVNMGYGLVFPTPGGLAVYSATSGGDLLTKAVHDWDTWRVSVDPTTLVARQYNGRYFATSASGSFVFERNDQIGGYLVELSQTFTTAYYDQLAAKMYYAYGTNVYLWDDPTQPYGSMDWKSKVMVTKDYINLGAARVVADYGSNPNDAILAAQNAATIVANQALITSNRVGGAIGAAPFSAVPIAGSYIQTIQPLGTYIGFSLYVNKNLIYSYQITSSAPFRLPTGYRSDTFEVRVTGNTRVRAIHLAETPFGLKQV